MRCPKTTNVSGRAVPNDFLDERLGNTLEDDFAQSCNTAFLEAGQAELGQGALPALSKDVFGLGLVWQTGLPAFDTKVPLESNPAETAMAYIGQGRIQTNSLAMASVAATVPAVSSGSRSWSRARPSPRPPVRSTVRSSASCSR